MDRKNIYSRIRSVAVNLFVIVCLLYQSTAVGAAQANPSQSLAAVDDPTPPTSVVKLIFIHHSTGQNWLDDSNGGLGLALSQNNYFVSDTNYGWGPNSIGDRTDIPNWLEWFRSADTPTYMTALYAENGIHSPYTRTLADPGDENEIILFKSCFPNSALEGNPDDPPSPDGWLTVGHAKYVYNQLLLYFQAHPDKFFVVITAPPLTDGTYAANARAFNQWLMYNWLSENNYTLQNVAIFDFYNVLTGPNNHHRYYNSQIQHIFTAGMNTEYYPSGDDHPSQTGNLKATSEFLPLLNIFYHRWKNSLNTSIFLHSGSWTGAGHGTDGWYVGDFNGDGQDDIFRYVPGVSGAQVFLSNGTKFVYSGSWTGAGHGTDGWYVGDFNGDGRDDLFRYVPGTSGADVFLSNGTKFVYSGSWTGAGHGIDGWYVGDFNGDGKDDIYRYVPGTSGADVFLSNGTRFIYSGSWTAAGHGTDGWYVGDFNGDGKDDIFRYVAGTSGADVFLSNGTKFIHSGSWTSTDHGADGWYVGDYNGDAKDDIFRYLAGVSGADVFLCTWAAGSTATGTVSVGTPELDEDMMLDVHGARPTEVSFGEEVGLLAPFMTRMIMGDEVSIYEIKTAYEQRVGRVVRLVEIRQMLQRHGYWDVEGQVGWVRKGR